MIKVDNLNKYYHKGKDNEIHVINNTSLVLPNSGFIVFLGASGSGKTTLINVIAGLDKAKGEITYDDLTFKNYKMNKIDKFRRENIGYVFQNYNLLPNITVYENLRLVLELMNITNKEEVDERINYVLDMLGILKYKNKLASNLSGGQMQRVSIARALVKDSKIIIADEPTGNLDSENTIEVMNILKAISKERLVIMVTHDRKNANFYADRIITIKDGVVESDNENNGSDSLENVDNTKIYLKDLNEKVLTLGNVKINLYVDNDEDIEDLELTIVKKDGNIYLKNDQVKYLNNNSKIKLIDDNYRDIKKEDIEAFNYNPKPFSETKKKFSLRPLWHSIADAYRNVKQSSKKMKGLYACFIIIGVVMAVCIMMLSVGTYVSGNQIEYSDVGIELKEWNPNKYDEALDKAVNEGLIKDFALVGPLNLKITNDTFALDNFYTRLHYSFINDKVIEGTNTLSNDSEIIITKRAADEFIKYCSNIEKLTYKSLIGMKSNDCTIVGIVDSQATNYYGYRYNYELDYYKTMKYPRWDGTPIEYYKNIDYEIVGGRDISASNECLINVTDYFDGLSEQPNFSYGYGTFEIVGIFKSSGNYQDSPTALLYDYDFVKDYFNDYSVGVGRNLEISFIPAEEKELVSGVMPAAFDEVLVSQWYDENNTSYDITKNYINENNLKVVGRFKSNFNIEANLLAYSREGILRKQCQSHYTLISTDSANEQKAIELFKQYGNIYETSYKYNHDIRVKEKAQMFGSTIAVSFIFVVIIVIYMFFMMRSKMIHRIYEIGVLREIGASKGKIYRAFLIELIVLVFMTTMLGYLVSLILCFLANQKIGGMLGLFRYSPLYAIGGFVVLLGVSIIAGMLPIFTLQRKTPAEIVAKYDL